MKDSFGNSFFSTKPSGSENYGYCFENSLTHKGSKLSDHFLKILYRRTANLVQIPFGQNGIRTRRGLFLSFENFSFENQIGINFLSIALLNVGMGFYYWWYVAIPIIARYPKSTPTGTENIISHKHIYS